MSYCLRLLYKKAGDIALDPGLILVFVTAFSATANILFFELLFDGFNNNAWVLWESRETLQNIILLNIIFCSVFTFFYINIIKLQSSKIDIIPFHIYRSQYNPVYWILVYAIIFILGQVLLATGQSYILTYWGNVIDLAFLIALGSILIQIKGIRTTFFCLSLFILFTMFIYYPIIIGQTEVDGYIVNKGGVVKMLIFCLVFLSLTKYKQLLVSPKKIIYGLLFLPLFLGFANFIEGVAAGIPPAFSTFLIYSLSGYEFQILENQAVIYDDITNNNLELAYGDTYLKSLFDIFIPTSDWRAPSEWFANRMNIAKNADDGAGYAFSAIAEGLMNFGIIGVAISAVIYAVILSSIRLLYGINLFLKPTMISALVTLPYYVYRSDFSDVIKKIEFMLISLFVIINIYLLVKYVLRKGRVIKKFSSID